MYILLQMFQTFLLVCYADLPNVVSICATSKKEITFDEVPVPEALARLESEGADVVALNCARGPKTMLPLIEKCKAVCKVMQLHYLPQYTFTLNLKYYTLK